MTEMQQYLGVLKQLKDFDENLSREIAAKAYQEQEKIKLEVQTDDAIFIDLIIILLFNGKKIENDKCWERRIGNEEWGKGKWEEGRRKENWEWKME